MKKANLCLSIVMVLVLLFQPLISFADSFESIPDQKFMVTIDDVFPILSKAVGEPMLLTSHRTVVPIRVIAENMGYDVTWDQEKYEATIDNGETTVLLHVNTPYATINGERVYVDYTGVGSERKPVVETKSFIKEGRTYIPLRFIAEAFNGNVHYERMNDGTHRIEIQTPNYTPHIPGKVITFDPTTDLMADGRMTQEKTREFLNEAIDHFTVTPTSFSYDKMDLPEGFRLGIAFSALAGPGETIRFNSAPILEEHRIPSNESFTRSLDSNITTKAGFILRLAIVNSAGKTSSRYDIDYMPNTIGRSEISMTNFQGGFDKIVIFDKTRIFEGL